MSNLIKSKPTKINEKMKVDDKIITIFSYNAKPHVITDRCPLCGVDRLQFEFYSTFCRIVLFHA